MPIPVRKPKGRPNRTPVTPPSDPWWKKDRKAPVAAKIAMMPWKLWLRWWKNGTLSICRFSRTSGTYSIVSTTK